jgi:hypothetical protein
MLHKIEKTARVASPENPRPSRDEAKTKKTKRTQSGPLFSTNRQNESQSPVEATAAQATKCDKMRHF